jgi:hypothetical protein
MAFYVSPSVNIIEEDFSGFVRGVPSSAGAVVGVFNWGPVNSPFQVSHEEELVSIFGKSDSNTASWFLSASSFLAYSSNLLVTRVKTTSMNTANALGATFLIENDEVFSQTAAGDLNNAGTFCARYPGSIGNSLSISMCDYASWSKSLTGSIATTNSSAAIVGTGTAFTTECAVGDTLKFTVNSTDFSIEILSITDDTHLTLKSVLPAAVGYTGSGLTATAEWKYKSDFNYRPDTTSNQDNFNTAGRDELHIVVVDSGGLITGVAGTILEKFVGVSKALDAKNSEGTNNYYLNVLNKNSAYVYATEVIGDANVTADLLSATGSNPGVNLSVTAFKTLNRNCTVTLSAGDADSDTYTNASFLNALDILADDSKYDVSLLFVGKANSTVANYAINSVAEIRKDCIVCISPEDVSDGSVIYGNTSTQIDKLIAFKELITASSYAVIDNGYKYMYDRYNDMFRWVPLCGDIAGLCARTDFVADPWFSPAGHNRGQIKNCLKVAVSPNKTQRGTLYQKNINFVIPMKGEGHLLYGDKTALVKPSAFDHINVRRLFIILEKSIANAAKFLLFENNTVYTRAQFKAMVEPFLRDVQGRQGITDFSVVVDETVNTPQVIASNTFKARILIKPVYSINFIELRFGAVGATVEFEEIAGLS